MVFVTKYRNGETGSMAASSLDRDIHELTKVMREISKTLDKIQKSISGITYDQTVLSFIEKPKELEESGCEDNTWEK